MDDSLRGHRASHEAHELQLGAILRHRPHGLISDLHQRKEDKVPGKTPLSNELPLFNQLASKRLSKFPSFTFSESAHDSKW